MRIQLVATCLFGLEHLLGEEIERLGYERTYLHYDWVDID